MSRLRGYSGNKDDPKVFSYFGYECRYTPTTNHPPMIRGAPMEMSRVLSQVITIVTKSDHMNYILQISDVKRKFILDKINLSARRVIRLHHTTSNNQLYFTKWSKFYQTIKY